MKKNSIIMAVLAASLFLGQPMVAQEQSGLKKQYKEFTGAFKCAWKKGYRACNPAQKRKIKQAGAAGITLVAAIALTAGGIWWWAKCEMDYDLVMDRGHENQTYLHHWASCGDSIFCKRLIELGVDVNARDDNGQTPLHWAVCCFGAEAGATSQLLLTRGADVNAQDNQGRTPLHWAVNDCNLLLVKVLIKNGGADPFIEDDDHKISLDFLKEGPSADSRHRDAWVYESDWQEIEKLLEEAMQKRRLVAAALSTRKVGQLPWEVIGKILKQPIFLPSKT